MICPHCGYTSPETAAECPRCAQLLRPPAPPRRRRSTLLAIPAVIVLVLIAFVAVARGFRERTGSSISFFGKRAHYDFGTRSFTIPPGGLESLSVRNPPRTPVCRLYVTASTAARPVRVVVLDSANLELLQSGAAYRAAYDAEVTDRLEFTAQVEGGNVSHHLALRNLNPRDSARVIVERLRAQCFEKW